MPLDQGLQDGGPEPSHREKCENTSADVNETMSQAVSKLNQTESNQHNSKAFALNPFNSAPLVYHFRNITKRLLFTNF